MPRITVGTVVKLLIASVIIGFVLAKLEYSPKDLIASVFQNLQGILEWSVDAFGDAITYALLGAVIVIPIWLISYLLQWMKKEK
ncbi:MAG: hypothetical protein HOL85_20710 [Rhodospirillaceae bacterium]|jgi:hypothetical protein|nr:hypothetical protein [Rhodospirillaceae bacterium]MBT6139083.1 hypothetical protein [Rhodospirillaceae bacterium]